VTFALLTGNGDLHAKNLSVVNIKGEWLLAPAYDLPSSIFYGDKKLALSMGDKKTDISRKQLIAFGNDLGLQTKIAERILDNFLNATAELEEELKAGALPFDQNRVAQTISALRYRRKLLTG
jgi:serine/threonine-protein kinase HipA